MNLGVGVEEFAKKMDISKELNSNIVGPYKSNGTIATNTKCYMLSIIAIYSNIVVLG